MGVTGATSMVQAQLLMSSAPPTRPSRAGWRQTLAHAERLTEGELHRHLPLRGKQRL